LVLYRRMELRVENRPGRSQAPTTDAPISGSRPTRFWRVMRELQCQIKVHERGNGNPIDITYILQRIEKRHNYLGSEEVIRNG
jgi:hypothetical protein